MSQLKVRFAPSPTGYLHIGGLRTALINYMYAKKNDGKIVLRIEDTDIERSKKEYEDVIVEALKWAGIEWDEFYRQSERIDRYEHYFRKIISENKGYYCFCSAEEDEEKSCECGKLNKEQAAKRAADGEKHTIKLRNPEKDIIVVDEIKGNVEFKKDNFKDFIIKKSDGMPVFHFAVVIDDFEMGINMIIRGEDHLSNTPRHMMIYEAIGADVPKYAHLPLMLGEDKTRLSKRHGVVSIDNFKENGIIKEGLINYLTVLGFSMSDENEVFSLEERMSDFDIHKMSSKATVFSYDKLNWFSKTWLQKKSFEEVYQLFEEYLYKYNIIKEYNQTIMKEAVALAKDKVSTLKEMFEYISFLFIPPKEYDEKGYKKFVEGDENKALLTELLVLIESMEWTSIEGIMDKFRQFTESKGISLNKAVQPVRMAVAGKLVSPGLFESIFYLGKEETTARIKKILI